MKYYIIGGPNPGDSVPACKMGSVVFGYLSFSTILFLIHEFIIDKLPFHTALRLPVRSPHDWPWNVMITANGPKP